MVVVVLYYVMLYMGRSETNCQCQPEWVRLAGAQGPLKVWFATHNCTGKRLLNSLARLCPDLISLRIQSYDSIPISLAVEGISEPSASGAPALTNKEIS